MEVHECQDCYYVGVLSEHGSCRRCGSQAVISEAIISKGKNGQTKR